MSLNASLTISTNIMKKQSSSFIKEEILEVETKQLLNLIDNKPNELGIIYDTFLKENIDVADVLYILEKTKNAKIIYYQGSVCFEYLMEAILLEKHFDKNSKTLFALKRSLPIDKDDTLVNTVKNIFTNELIINTIIDKELEKEQFEALLLVT